MVYFMRASKTGAIKIGYVSRGRVSEQIAEAEERDIQLLAIVSGGIELERKLHRRFEPNRLEGVWWDKGGWFKITDAAVRKAVAECIKSPEADTPKQVTTSDANRLEVIKEVFALRDRVLLGDLAKAIGCTPKAMTRWLVKFEIQSRQVRVGNQIVEGFLAEDFEELITKVR